MNRYHNKVYFPYNAKKDLQDFTAKQNRQEWHYTAHCLDNVRSRAIDCRALLEFIKAQQLDAETIFEYYLEFKRIIKACYRINWSAGIDVILVIGEGKQIITIYLNSVDDEHYTLNKMQYMQE